MKKSLSYAFTAAVLGGGGYALGAGALGVGFTATAAPLMLALGGAALPGMWWLLNAVPPKPKPMQIPSIRLLFDIDMPERKPASMPIWWKMICMGAATLSLLAAAQPDFDHHKGAITKADGPVVLALDSGWEAAKNWDARKTQILGVLDAADKDGRKVMLLTTAPVANGQGVKLSAPMSAKEARPLMMRADAVPWPVDRGAAIKALQDVRLPQGEKASVYWFSDGLDHGAGQKFMDTLSKLGSVTVYEDNALSMPHILSLAPEQNGKLTVHVARAQSDEKAEMPQQGLALLALDENGKTVFRAEANFAEGASATDVVFDMPDDVRKTLSRIVIEGEHSVGGTLLLDENWQERSVGLISSPQQNGLLDGANYARQALVPFTDFHEGSLDKLLAANLSVMVMTDDVVLTDSDHEKLAAWVKNGGTLLRFAGPRLAVRPDDSLLPVTIREGEKHLRGGLDDNSAAQKLDFTAKSPFKDMKAPADLNIRTIVLPQPGPDLEERTWAGIETENGTLPLVTAKQDGKGWSILVHTSAGPQWSNMPLSGDFFLKTLRAIVAHSTGASGHDQLTRDLPALMTIDPDGRLRTASGKVKPLTQSVLDSGKIGQQNPAGIYGDDSMRFARNIGDVEKGLTALGGDVTSAADVRSYEVKQGGINWKGWLLAGAMTLLMADQVLRLTKTEGRGLGGLFGGAATGRREERRRKNGAAKNDNGAASKKDRKPAVS